MVDRPRLAVAALVVVAGAGLYALGSGPAAPGGTVATNDVPSVAVTATPGENGSVTVRHDGGGDRASTPLAVDWNGSLRVAAGDRRLDAAGERVVLAERAGAGTTTVRLTVTTADDGEARVVYRETLRL